MFRDGLLSGKVVIVTGGGTGLGRSMATRLGELGARLVLTSRSLEHLEEAATDLRQRGITVETFACDVRDAERVAAMVSHTVEHFGRVDALINNAAGNFLCKTEELTPNGFATVIGIVLQGTFNCSHAVGKQLILQGGGGSILNIVATYAWTGQAYVVPSASAKAGVWAMTQSLAVEWGKYGIRCNAIAPGPFPTDGAWKRLVPTGLEEAMPGISTKRIPAGRYGKHEELANLAAYLLADESAYITGDCIVIDGGEWLMGGPFNQMTQVDQTALGQMFSAMRGPKK